jgi:hypothetical protein
MRNAGRARWVEKRRDRIALRQRIGPAEFDQGGEVIRREQQITGQRRSSAGTHAHRLQQQPRATGMLCQCRAAMASIEVEGSRVSVGRAR